MIQENQKFRNGRTNIKYVHRPYHVDVKHGFDINFSIKIPNSEESSGQNSNMDGCWNILRGWNSGLKIPPRSVHIRFSNESVCNPAICQEHQPSEWMKFFIDSQAVSKVILRREECLEELGLLADKNRFSLYWVSGMRIQETDHQLHVNQLWEYQLIDK